jgi:hypothetical protein
MKREHQSLQTKAADLVFVAGGLLCLLALIYLVFRDVLIGESQHASVVDAAIRYGLPAMASVALVTGLRLRPQLRENVALLLVSSGLALLCAEIVLENVRPTGTTLWTPATKEDVNRLVRLARRFGVEYDSRTQLQVVSDLRSQGVDAVPAVYPFGHFARQPDGTVRSQITIGDTEFLPLSGISNSLTVFCNESGDWVTYQSDEHGFNNPRGIWDSETLDVAVLGDSFAQGACVPSDRSFAGVIREHIPATLNLGNSNKGPLMSLADLKEYAAPYRPRVVLWFFYEENDFGDLIRESDSPLLMNYLDRDFVQGLLDRPIELDRALERHWVHSLEKARTQWPDKRKSAIRDVVRLGGIRRTVKGFRGPADREFEMEQSNELLAIVLAEATSTVESWGGRLYVVYLPERERFVKPRTANLDEKKRKLVRNVSHSAGAAFIDVRATFESSGDPLGLFPFRRRGHYNADGHRLVAETVLRTIAISTDAAGAEAS